MKYTIVSHWKREQFQAEVERHLRQGWTLQGGVATTDTSVNASFHQAMVKEERQDSSLESRRD